MSSEIDRALQFNRTALNILAERQGLLAANIANADTPNFKARDVDFASALKHALSEDTTKLAANSAVPLAHTAPKHLSGQTGENIMGSPVMYRNVLQPSADGNTVDMDRERAQFADNAVRYEASLKFIDSKIKGILSAIQG